MTTQKAKNELLARRRNIIGKEYPTWIGGVAKITAHDEQTGVYTSTSGCIWELSNDVLTPRYSADFLTKEALNMEKVRE